MLSSQKDAIRITVPDEEGKTAMIAYFYPEHDSAADLIEQLNHAVRVFNDNRQV